MDDELQATSRRGALLPVSQFIQRMCRGDQTHSQRCMVE